MRVRARALCLLGALVAAPVASADEPVFTRGVLGGRAYRLFAPPAPGAERRPLILALHGCWQTPETFALGTRLNDAAARRGALVLYPAQTAADNPSRCWNWFLPAHQTRRSGEVADILALAAEVRRRHPVDGERVIALGFSAGAFTAVNLACAAPDVISGVGALAGGPYRCGLGVDGALQCMRGHGVDGAASAAACLAAMGRQGRAVRASLWHGAEDTVVSAANFDALLVMFARVGGMVSGVTERTKGALRSVYRDGQGRPVIETWLVPGMGHAWSGGDARGTLTYPAGPSATDHMLDFLLPRP